LDSRHEDDSIEANCGESFEEESSACYSQKGI